MIVQGWLGWLSVYGLRCWMKLPVVRYTKDEIPDAWMLPDGRVIHAETQPYGNGARY